MVQGAVVPVMTSSQFETIVYCMMSFLTGTVLTVFWFGIMEYLEKQKVLKKSVKDSIEKVKEGARKASTNSYTHDSAKLKYLVNKLRCLSSDLFPSTWNYNVLGKSTVIVPSVDGTFLRDLVLEIDIAVSNTDEVFNYNDFQSALRELYCAEDQVTALKTIPLEDLEVIAKHANNYQDSILRHVLACKREGLLVEGPFAIAGSWLLPAVRSHEGNPLQYDKTKLALLRSYLTVPMGPLPPVEEGTRVLNSLRGIENPVRKVATAKDLDLPYYWYHESLRSLLWSYLDTSKNIRVEEIED